MTQAPSLTTKREGKADKLNREREKPQLQVRTIHACKSFEGIKGTNKFRSPSNQNGNSVIHVLWYIYTTGITFILAMLIIPFHM